MNNFKKQRLAAQMLQEDVAKEIGVSEVAVSFWENGRSTPTWKHCKALAKLYGCSVSELLDDD